MQLTAPFPAPRTHAWPPVGDTKANEQHVGAKRPHEDGGQRKAEKQPRWRAKGRQPIKEGMVFLVSGGTMPHIVERRMFEEGADEAGCFVILAPVLQSAGARTRVHSTSLQTLGGEGRFARLWAAHKHRADSIERAGLLEAVKVSLKSGWKAVATFHKLVGDEQEPAPRELVEHDTACAS